MGRKLITDVSQALHDGGFTIGVIDTDATQVVFNKNLSQEQIAEQTQRVRDLIRDAVASYTDPITAEQRIEFTFDPPEL